MTYNVNTSLFGFRDIMIHRHNGLYVMRKMYMTYIYTSLETKRIETFTN